MTAQLDAWELTASVRQHAVAVYRKSGCAGRSELAAFFLEGVSSVLRDDARPPG